MESLFGSVCAEIATPLHEILVVLFLSPKWHQTILLRNRNQIVLFGNTKLLLHIMLINKIIIIIINEWNKREVLCQIKGNYDMKKEKWTILGQWLTKAVMYKIRSLICLVFWGHWFYIYQTKSLSDHALVLPVTMWKILCFRSLPCRGIISINILVQFNRKPTLWMVLIPICSVSCPAMCPFQWLAPKAMVFLIVCLSKPPAEPVHCRPKK